ncbi:MAG: LysM peptidoglycan-binding domain-containing protein [Planctomycetota bacterium]|jgi:LysM repeat protein|nr:LysM peptidoglycan-binding domain-containing protein [Planctomycetota bacterium]
MRVDRIVVVAIILGLGIFINLFTVLNPWSDAFKRKAPKKLPDLTANLDDIANANEVWTEIIPPRQNRTASRTTSTFRDAVSDPALRVRRIQPRKPDHQVQVRLGGPRVRPTSGQRMPARYNGDVVYINEREGSPPEARPGRLHTSTATPAPPAVTHQVKRGETLSSIAVKYYGKADRWTRIKKANTAVLSKSKWLLVGMKLKIPGAPGASLQTTTARQPRSSSQPEQTTKYTIKRGDTLMKIARAIYGKSSKWRRIQEANPGLKPRAIVPGRKIVIPL